MEYNFGIFCMGENFGHSCIDAKFFTRFWTLWSILVIFVWGGPNFGQCGIWGVNVVCGGLVNAIFICGIENAIFMWGSRKCIFGKWGSRKWHFLVIGKWVWKMPYFGIWGLKKNCIWRFRKLDRFHSLPLPISKLNILYKNDFVFKKW